MKLSIVFVLALLISGTTGAIAQDISGTPGSPSATTTIDGRQIPPPPGQFGGTINLDALTQRPTGSPGGAAEGRAQHPPDHDR